MFLKITKPNSLLDVNHLVQERKGVIEKRNSLIKRMYTSRIENFIPEFISCKHKR